MPQDKRISDVDLLTEQGLQEFRDGSHSKSIDTFEWVLEIDPRNEHAFALRIESLRFLKNHEQAGREIERALKLLPDSVAIRNERGRWHYDQERYKEAAAAFDEVLQIDPKNEDALQGKIASLRILKNYDEGGQEIERALKLLPDSVELRNERGRWHYDQERYKEAAAAFDEVLQVDPKNEDALQGKISSLRILKNYDEAGQEIEQALRLLPDSVAIRNERGRWHGSQERYKEAAAAFDEVLRIDPKNEDALQRKIKSLRLLEDYNEAGQEIERALRLLPDSVAIRNEHGRWHYEQKRCREAAAAFEEVLQIDPKNEDALQGKIASLRVLKNYDEAGREIERALRLFPDSVAIRNQRGRWHYDQEHYKEAAAAFDEVLQIAPKNEYALQGKVKSLRLLKDDE